MIGAVRPRTMRRPETGRTYGFGGMLRPAHGAVKSKTGTNQKRPDSVCSLSRKPSALDGADTR
jgi:hypothetical protein